MIFGWMYESIATVYLWARCCHSAAVSFVASIGYFMSLPTCVTFLTFLVIISLHLINCWVSNFTSPNFSTWSSTTSVLINPHSLYVTIKTPSYSALPPTSSSFLTSKTTFLSPYSTVTEETADLTMTAVKISSVMTLFSTTLSMNAILY